MLSVGNARVLATNNEVLDINHFSTWQASGALLLLALQRSCYLLLRLVSDGPFQSNTKSFDRSQTYQTKETNHHATSDVILSFLHFGCVLPPLLSTLFCLAAKPCGIRRRPLLATPCLSAGYTGDHALSGDAGCCDSPQVNCIVYRAACAGGFSAGSENARSVLIAHGLLTLLLYRSNTPYRKNWSNKLQFRNHASTCKRCNVLIYGAGSAGVSCRSTGISGN